MLNVSSSGISWKIDFPELTGNSYVDSCFHPEFEEKLDTRDWRKIADLRSIPLTSRRNPREAIEILEAMLSTYPNYSFIYHWLGMLRGQLGQRGEPMKTYLEGLKSSCSKYVLCASIGDYQFRNRGLFRPGNLAEGVKWSVRSSAIQMGSEQLEDNRSFLGLAYAAWGLKPLAGSYATKLHQCGDILYDQAQYIREAVFDEDEVDKRYALARKQGNLSIINAILLLCNHYLSS